MIQLQDIHKTLGSKQILKGMGFTVPAALARYDSGLIFQDKDGDGAIDPKKDQIIGGVSTTKPIFDAKFEVKSWVQQGKATVSQATGVFSKGAGDRFGGAIAQVQFTADRSGTYRPTFSLLKDLDDINSGDGSSYTYTVIVR